MKKPFDIKYRPQIESGEYKVETRLGHPVEILRWDTDRMKYPILALIGNSNAIFYGTDGRTGLSRQLPSDLFVITPEPELTEFEKHVQAVMMNSGLVGCTESYKNIDTVKTTSRALLEYAKAELQSKNDTTNVDDALIDSMMAKWHEYKLRSNISFDCHEVEAYRQGLTDMYKELTVYVDYYKRWNMKK